jgi:hypothetical protein
MATSALHVMPTPASEARELDQNIRSAVKRSHQSYAHIAYYGWRLKECDGFKEIGYLHEHAYMMSLGIGKSLWYEAVAVGQALASMPLVDLEKIPVGCLQLLLQVKPEVRQSYDWATEAKTDTFRQLAEKVQERNRLAPGPERVPMSPLSIRVPSTAKEAIFTSLKDYQEKHNLTSVGQALEFVVADKTQGESALSSLHQAWKLMNGLAKSLERHPNMVDELNWCRLAKDRVYEVYQDILKSNREVGDEIHAEEVYQGEASGDAEEDLIWDEEIS